MSRTRAKRTVRIEVWRPLLKTKNLVDEGSYKLNFDQAKRLPSLKWKQLSLSKHDLNLLKRLEMHGSIDANKVLKLWSIETENASATRTHRREEGCAWDLQYFWRLIYFVNFQSDYVLVFKGRTKSKHVFHFVPNLGTMHIATLKVNLTRWCSL